MSVTTTRRRAPRALAATLVAATTLLGACGDDTKSPAGPSLPGNGPAAAFRPVAFIADVDLRKGIVRITPPASGTLENPSLSLAGIPDGANLSLLGGDAIRIIPSNYQASAVGAFVPGRVRVTFDVQIENKLPGIQLITPTWPAPPAPGVILIPLDQTVTTTPGGVTGGEGNEVVVELPSYGQVNASIDWNGTGAAGSGSPFNFFNDADCGLATSNDCFRWKAYSAPLLPLTGSELRSVGFDLDPTVGQFRARMIVAADLASSAPVAPATVSGTVTSPVRGALAGVTVAVGGQSATTAADGSYSIAGITPGAGRVITLSALPGGCTTPASRTVDLAPGATSTQNFTVECSGLPGSLSGTVTRSNDGSPLAGVTVTASGGGSATTSAAGAYTIAGVTAGAGSLSVSGAPAECSPSATAYTLPSAGSVTQNIVVTCGAPPQPGYQYNAAWTNLGNGEFALELRIDMRTFDDPAIVNQTAGGVSSDPLTGAQLTLTYDATRLAFARSEDPAAPLVQADPTVNGSTPGSVSVLAGTTNITRVGNVGVVRIVFTRVAGATGTVTPTTALIAASSRTGTTTVNITTRVVNLVNPTLTLP